MAPVLALVLLLAAPAPPTPVGPRPLYAKLGPTRWRVGAVADAALDPETTRTAILRTAADLTVRAGFDWFVPIGEPREPAESTLTADPAPGAARRLRWGVRCKGGWTFADAPGEHCPADAAAAAPRFEATTQIEMGHGPTPKTGDALNARDILSGRGASRGPRT